MPCATRATNPIAPTRMGTMDDRRLGCLPPHVWAHMLRTMSLCEVVRFAHTSRELHTRIMGTKSCRCVQESNDYQSHPMGHSAFWAHWCDHGMASDDVLVECCRRGHVTCVRVLLARGYNPAQDQQVAFVQACIHGRVAVVRELLRDVRIDPALDTQKALVRACAEGQDRVVERLLADERVDPCADDHLAIHMASQNGHADVVARLLADGRADPRADDHLAIQIASQDGHADVVALLLADGRADPRADDDFSIRKASQNGHADVVALLLRDGRADPCADEQYALHFACLDGHADVVVCLLRDGRVDPRARYSSSLLSACRLGHAQVVAALLDDGRVDPGIDNQWPMRLACMYGHADVVDRLLDDPRVDARACLKDAIDNDEQDGRHAAVVERLLREPNVDVTFDDGAAIRWACRRGHATIVDRLLDDARVDVRGCLKEAIEHDNYDGRHVAVVERLLREPNVDVTYDDGQPMDWACRRGLASVVERLLQFPQIRRDCCAITDGWHATSDQGVRRALRHHARTVPYQRCSRCREEDYEIVSDVGEGVGDLLLAVCVLTMGYQLVSHVGPS